VAESADIRIRAPVAQLRYETIQFLLDQAPQFLVAPAGAREEFHVPGGTIVSPPSDRRV
jgi:hypothetical protein